VKVFLGVFRQIEWYITRHAAEGPLPSTNGGSKPSDSNLSPTTSPGADSLQAD
jgi:hypothetical protein